MEVMTVKEAAEFLKVPEYVVLKATEENKIPYLNLFGEIRILKNALVESMTEKKEAVTKKGLFKTGSTVRKAKRSGDSVFDSDDLALRLYSSGRIYFNKPLRDLSGATTSDNKYVTLELKGSFVEICVYDSKDDAPYNSFLISNGIMRVTSLLKGWGVDYSEGGEFVVKEVGDQVYRVKLPMLPESEREEEEDVNPLLVPAVRLSPNGKLSLNARAVAMSNISEDNLYEFFMSDEEGIMGFLKTPGNVGYRPFESDRKLCFDLASVMDRVDLDLDEDLLLEAGVVDDFPCVKKWAETLQSQGSDLEVALVFSYK
jgi:excisionase family DNA binding protein